MVHYHSISPNPAGEAGPVPPHHHLDGPSGKREAIGLHDGSSEAA